jgi:hypothetical protein
MANRHLPLVVILALGCNGVVGNVGDRPSGAAGIAGQASDGTGGPSIGADGRYICNGGRHPTASEARRLTTFEYQNAIRDIFGAKVTASAQYPGSYGKSSTGYSTEPDINTVGEQGVESLMKASEDVAEGVAASLSTLLPCAAVPGDPGETCVGTFIDSFIRRAYRRPPTGEERSQLLTTYREGRASGANFSEGVAMLTSHALQTAQFLYITEAAAPAPGRTLDPYELASRLSFLFWGSVPDDALLEQAAQGALTNEVTLANEARRLLADPRADSSMQRLIREWSQTNAVSPADKDPSAFPGFDAAQALAIGASFDRFSADQMRNGTLTTLLNTREAWVDSTAATFFGVTATGSGWDKVAVDPTRYAGIATQPAFLASAAHFNTTSYVFRGRFVRKRLLCADMPPPPANAQAAFDQIAKPQDPTGKDLSAAVTAVAVCGACHKLIDPGGLSLENFDAIGKYRANYPSGKPIDPSGRLDAVGDHGIDFTSPIDLFSKLAAEPSVATCFSKQLLRFAFSRLDNEQDACAVQAVGDVLQGGGQLAAALTALAQSDAFIERRDP